MRSKQHLVTGGCGFIGSHLVKKLIKNNSHVTIIDDLSSGSLDNISSVQETVSFIEGRVQDLNLESMPHFDGVYHLAAQASVPFSLENFVASSSANISSSINIIDHCIKTDTPFVYASSSAVYGNIDIGHEAGSTELLSPYAADKYAMEIYCKMAEVAYGLRSFGLRFFNVYGPNQDPENPYSGVISIFVNRLLENQHINVNGGHQTRDFVYVDDVVQKLTNAMDYLNNNRTAAISNILTGTSISINDLVEIIADIIGVKPRIEYKELPSGDPLASNGNTEVMKQYFGNTEMHNLRHGLDQTIKWMKNCD